DLEVLDLAVLDLAADLGDLEPVAVAQCRGGPFDAVVDGPFEAVRGGADDLGHAVGAVGHAGLQAVGFLDCTRRTVGIWPGSAAASPRRSGSPRQQPAATPTSPRVRSGPCSPWGSAPCASSARSSPRWPESTGCGRS